MTKDENKAKQVQLLTEKQTLENRLDVITAELTKLSSDVCHWVYETHEDAELEITDELEKRAHNDCEGSYNCGSDFYEQDYTLLDSPVVYTGIIKVEYNRHDKTYYYVEEVQYSFKRSYYVI